MTKSPRRRDQRPRSIRLDASVRSGLIGHGKTDSISGISVSSPLTSPREASISGKLSRKGSDWTKGDVEEEEDAENRGAEAMYEEGSEEETGEEERVEGMENGKPKEESAEGDKNGA